MSNFFTRDTNRLPAPAPAAPAQYRAVVGLTTDDARYEPGTLVPNAVVEAAPWLLERGAVEFEAATNTPNTEDPRL